MKQNGKLPKFFLLTAVTAGFLISCGTSQEKRTVEVIEGNNIPYMEVRQNDSVVFYWDRPSIYTDSIKEYIISYKSKSDTVWSVCKKSIPDTSLSPKTTVYRDSIKSDDSVFVFGIQYMTMDSIFADVLKSTDTAAAAGGWYLFWKRPKK